MRRKASTERLAAEFGDRLAGQARYWARLADQEEGNSLLRTRMAVKAHAFAQAAAEAREAFGRRG